MNQKRTDIPDPVLSRHATAGRFLRFLYASLVIGLGLFLLWQVINPLLYTQSSGTVVASSYAISTPYIARVVRLPVGVGDTVSAGEVVATVRSPEIDALRASLLSNVAQQVNQEGELRIRLLVATNSLESAQKRAASTEPCGEELARYPDNVSSVFRAQMMRECATAAAELAKIEADISETSRQIDAVRGARKDIEDLKTFVDQAFNNGNQVSPIDGVVANHAVNEGQSVTAGNPILEVYDPEDLYVEWVLSDDRRIQPEVGALVFVRNGNRVTQAKITQILPISQQAPDGTSIFSRETAGQLARIELRDKTQYPAYLTDVQVRYNYWSVMDTIFAQYVRVMTGLGLWRGS